MYEFWASIPILLGEKNGIPSILILLNHANPSGEFPHFLRMDIPGCHAPESFNAGRCRHWWIGGWLEVVWCPSAWKKSSLFEENSNPSRKVRHIKTSTEDTHTHGPVASIWSAFTEVRQRMTAGAAGRLASWTSFRPGATWSKNRRGRRFGACYCMKIYENDQKWSNRVGSTCAMSGVSIVLRPSNRQRLRAAVRHLGCSSVSRSFLPADVLILPLTQHIFYCTMCSQRPQDFPRPHIFD